MSNELDPIESYSHIAAYGFAIASTLERFGVDPAVVFETCKIELPTTTDPMLRLSGYEVNRLFEESVRTTGAPLFGLLVGQSIRPGNLHALGYALMASTSLRDFAQRLKVFYKIASQSADIHFEESGDEFRLVSSVTQAGLCWETHDAFTALLVRFIRFIDSPTFSPLQLELIRPEPGEALVEYKAFFNCPIRFDCPDVVITIPLSQADRPLQGGNLELAQMHDKNIMQYLSRLERQDIVNRVRIMIVEGLSAHSITKARVADKLCMSSRSLQLKLASKGTSFQEILDSTRQNLALGYLEQSIMTITEAAYLTGFSDVSNFTRAFRRWTGQSPSEFRLSRGLVN